MKLIFVSLDTLRADRLGCMGYRRDLTPTLDRLAAEGALFERAFATDIPTQPSHTALFTGRFGVNTGVVSHFLPSTSLGEHEPWLPSILRSGGMPTAAVDHLFSMKGWFERGYQDYMPPPGRSRAPGAVINDLAFPWIEKHADEEFFLFLHFWDAHIPYLPPEDFRKHSMGSQGRVDPLLRQRLRSRPTYPLFKHNLYDHLGGIPNIDYIADLYDDEVAYLDHELGRLVQHLADLGILDETMLVFFGDHGENMVEHDAWFDHAGLYESVVHVPLLMWRPGTVPATRVPAMVALVDVMPTTLELLEHVVPTGLDGRSLVPLMEGTTTRHREEIVLCEATWQAKRAIRTEEWKLIHCYDPGVFLRSETELYNLVEDPSEQDNVASAHPEVVRELEGRMDRWLEDQLGIREDPVVTAVAEGLPAVARLDRVIEGLEAGNRPEHSAKEHAHVASRGEAEGDEASMVARAADEVRGDTFVLVTASAGAAAAAGAAAGEGAAATGFVGTVASASSELFALEQNTAPVPIVTGHGNGTEATASSHDPLGVGPPDAGQRFSPYRGDGPHNGRIRGPRLFLVGIALVAALALLGYTLSRILLSNSLSAVGVAAPADVAELNVANTGVITGIFAKVGEVVPAGKVLATQNTSTQEAQLTADQARLASDQAALQELSQPAQSSALINAQAQVASATVDLQNAQAKLSQTTAAQQAAVTAAQANVQSEQALYNADNQQYQAMIPACTSPNPPADCGNAEHQVQVDQNAVSGAQSAYQLALVTQSTTVGNAQTQVNQASAALSTANAAVTAATIPPTPQEVETATAKVQVDQAAVTKDRAALNQDELRAPFRGVVAAVGGTAGDVATPNGVQQGSAPPAVGGAQGSTGINIVTPSNPATASSGQQHPTSLITLNSLSNVIVAQVGEGDISRVKTGELATVTVPSAPGAGSFEVRVSSISPTPTIISGQPYYLVKLRPTRSANSIFARLPHANARGRSSGGPISDFTVNVMF